MEEWINLKDCVIFVIWFINVILIWYKDKNAQSYSKSLIICDIHLNYYTEMIKIE